MEPSRNPNYGPLSSFRNIMEVNNGLGQVRWRQQQSEQLRARNPQQNQQPLHFHASQSSDPQPQNQSIHYQQQQQQQQQHPQYSSTQLLALRDIQQHSRQLQFQPPPNLLWRSPVNQSYEPGLCAQRLTQYMDDQLFRPVDNNITFWSEFVAEYFDPNAKMKLCLSVYGNDHHTTGAIPQNVWRCELCNRDNGHGFVAPVELFPRLLKVKYESVLEELLCVNMPLEYINENGQIVLHFIKAVQESVFETFRVVRDGELRIVFNLDMKISSWEFCTSYCTEFISTRLLIPQVYQLGLAAQRCQHEASSNLSVPELQNTFDLLVSSAGVLSKSIEVSQVIDFGYPRAYIRTLQLADMINGLMDQTRQRRDRARQQMRDHAHQIMREQARQQMQDHAHQIMRDQARQQMQDQARQKMQDQARQQMQDQARQQMQDQARQQIQDQALQQIQDQARQQQINPIANFENRSPENEYSENKSEDSVQYPDLELGYDFGESAMNLFGNEWK